MEFTTTQLALALILGIVIYVIMLYLIIESATKSASSLKLQRMQVELLREIALKNGVEVERINEIIQMHNK